MPSERPRATRVNGVGAKLTEARKFYECAVCGRLIEPGQHYLYVNAFWPQRVCREHADA